MMNFKGVILLLTALTVFTYIANANGQMNIDRNVHTVGAGTFSHWSFCPNGGKAISFRNLFSPGVAVSGVDLKCDTTDQMAYHITSYIEQQGKTPTQESTICPEGFNGMQIKETVSNGIEQLRLICGNEPRSIRAPAGYEESAIAWKPEEKCADGQFICGINTAADMGNLRGVKFVCCYSASSNQSPVSKPCDFEMDTCGWTSPEYQVDIEYYGLQNETVYIRDNETQSRDRSMTAPEYGLEGPGKFFVHYESFVDRYLDQTVNVPRTFSSPMYNGTLWTDTVFEFYFHAYGTYLGDFYFEVLDNVTGNLIQKQTLYSTSEPDFIIKSDESTWYHVRFPIGLHLGGLNTEFYFRFIVNADYFSQTARDVQSGDFALDAFELNYTSSFTCESPGCHPNATCETLGDALAGINCTCNYGFVGNGENVADGCLPNNPCTLSNATCLQNYSQNSCDYVGPGLHNCTCGDGFELSTDNSTCVDINECDTVTCGNNATCTNIVGNFTCECDPGFTWDNVSGPENLTCGQNGGWTAWSLPDGSCSASCDGGTYNATRNCTNPTTTPPGIDCVGPSYNETAECNTDACPTSCPVWKNCTCSNFTAFYEGGPLDMTLSYFNGLSSDDLTYAMTKLSQWNQTVVEKVCSDASCDEAALGTSITAINADLTNITSLVDATSAAKIDMRHILDCNPANTSSHNEWLWDIFDKLCEYEAFLPNIQEDLRIKVDLLEAEKDRCTGRSHIRSLLELMYRKW